MILLRVRVLRCYQALHACHEKLCVLKRLRRRMRSSLAAVAFVFTTVGHLFRKWPYFMLNSTLNFAHSLGVYWGYVFSNLAASGACSIGQSKTNFPLICGIFVSVRMMDLPVDHNSDFIFHSCTFSMTKRSRNSSSDHDDGISKFMQIYVLCSQFRLCYTLVEFLLLSLGWDSLSLMLKSYQLNLTIKTICCYFQCISRMHC